MNGFPSPRPEGDRSRGSFFIGLQEVANFTSTLTAGLRECGYRVMNVVWEDTSPLLESAMERHDRHLPRAFSRASGRRRQVASVFIRAASLADVFVFTFGRSFTGWDRYNGVDLAVLRALGKRIVMVVLGSDLRDTASLAHNMRLAGLDEPAAILEREVDPRRGGSMERKMKRASIIQRYAHHIFARPMSAQLLTRKYHMLWLPLEVRTVNFWIPQHDRPLVVHAPSHPEIKGTKYVLATIRKLQRELDFDFRLLTGVPNWKVRDLLSRSDIVIDQLVLPGYGMFAVEAMAAGNAVIGSAVRGFNGFGDDLPIVTSTASTLEQNLRLLIERPDLRRSLAAKGRAYVERHHDHRAVAERFAALVAQ